MFVKEELNQLTPYIPGKTGEMIKELHGLEKITKLSSNENPFGASPLVSKAIKDFADFATYPDGASLALKDALSNHLDVKKEQLLFGAGADEVIQMISRGVLKSGDNIIQASPTFSQYEHHAIIEGANIKDIPLVNGVHDLEEMALAVNEQTKIIWVCNPNNPTGTYVNEETLVNFLKKIPSDVVVAVDEAYMEYQFAVDFPDTLKLLDQFPNLVVLRTFSKVYGLASFRIGYAVGNVEFIKALDVARLPFNTGSLAQIAAITALKDQSFVRDCVQKNLAGLKQYETFLTKANIPYYPSQGNFIFLPTTNGREIGNQLEKTGYIIRVFPSGIRITIGTQEDNEKIIGYLQDLQNRNVL